MLNATFKTRAAGISYTGIMDFIQSLLLPRGIIAVIPAYTQMQS